MKKLTNKEREVMELFWQHGPMFVRELLEHYEEPRPHFNTLSTIVRPERAAELLMLEQWDQIAFSDVMLNASTNGIKGGKTEYVVKDGKKISIPSNQTAVLYEVYPNIDMKEKYPPAIIK